LRRKSFTQDENTLDQPPVAAVVQVAPVSVKVSHGTFPSGTIELISSPRDVPRCTRANKRSRDVIFPSKRTLRLDNRDPLSNCCVCSASPEPRSRPSPTAYDARIDRVIGDAASRAACVGARIVVFSGRSIHSPSQAEKPKSRSRTNAPPRDAPEFHAFVLRTGVRPAFSRGSWAARTSGRHCVKTELVR